MSRSTSSITRTMTTTATRIHIRIRMLTGIHIPTITQESNPTMFEYEFMRNAFAASGIVAVLAGIVGYFLVLRGQTFAGHALSHVGFTGATGAVLIGISPIWGM